MHSEGASFISIMPTSLFVDWTGDPEQKDPHRTNEFYGPGVLICKNGDDLEPLIQELRNRFRIPSHVEFKGYNIWKYRGATLAVAECVFQEFQVVVHLLEKTALLQERGAVIFDKPRKLTQASTICALETIWETGTRTRVFYDRDDFEGKRARPFETAIRRSATRHRQIIEDVKGLASDKSAGIQLVDVIAHLLQKDANNAIDHSDLQRVVAKLKRKTGNEIRRIGGNDLRSYL